MQDARLLQSLVVGLGSREQKRTTPTVTLTDAGGEAERRLLNCHLVHTLAIAALAFD